MCFGELLLMRTLCDAYHKAHASHYRSILDISEAEGGRAIVLTMAGNLEMANFKKTLLQGFQ